MLITCTTFLSIKFIINFESTNCIVKPNNYCIYDEKLFRSKLFSFIYICIVSIRYVPPSVGKTIAVLSLTIRHIHKVSKIFHAFLLKALPNYREELFLFIKHLNCQIINQHLFITIGIPKTDHNTIEIVTLNFCI